tara:strand:+ start:458 stop:649 length:192 start_codon:yes stop_codon:yes gene_type:complete
MTQKTKDAVILWINQNRGILTKVARELNPPCSSQYVSQVARGIRRSKDGTIERKLKSIGCPLY